MFRQSIGKTAANSLIEKHASTATCTTWAAEQEEFLWGVWIRKKTSRELVSNQSAVYENASTNAIERHQNSFIIVLSIEGVDKGVVNCDLILRNLSLYNSDSPCVFSIKNRTCAHYSFIQKIIFIAVYRDISTDCCCCIRLFISCFSCCQFFIHVRKQKLNHTG